MISDKTVADFIASPRTVVEATHKAVEVALLHRQVKALEAIAGLLGKMVDPNGPQEAVASAGPVEQG